jgi:hypothetical protein
MAEYLYPVFTVTVISDKHKKSDFQEENGNFFNRERKTSLGLGGLV